MPKAPPPFVKSEAAWEYTLAKLAVKDNLTDNGDPKNYAAAIAIYKNVVAKYPAMHMGDLPEYHNRVGSIRNPPEGEARFTSPSELDEQFPVGSSFWWQDCIMTALDAGHGMAVQVAPDGRLMLFGQIEDVDEGGPHKDWTGKKSVVSAAHCLPLL